MACCIFNAYVMNKIIDACELFDIKILDIKHNDFEDGFIDWETTRNTTNFISTRLSISGMIFGASTGTIEKAIQQVEGVDRVSSARRTVGGAEYTVALANRQSNLLRSSFNGAAIFSSCNRGA
jgi:hypothetical protein